MHSILFLLFFVSKQFTRFYPFYNGNQQNQFINFTTSHASTANILNQTKSNNFNSKSKIIEFSCMSFLLTENRGIIVSKSSTRSLRSCCFIIWTKQCSLNSLALKKFILIFITSQTTLDLNFKLTSFLQILYLGCLTVSWFFLKWFESSLKYIHDKVRYVLLLSKSWLVQDLYWTRLKR